MASSTRTPPKKGKLKQMPSTSGGVGIEERPETHSTPFDPEPQAAAAPPTHPTAPPAPQTATPDRQNVTKKDFFDLVRRVQKEDWGTRIFMYLYCYEPVCDEKISGEKKYLCRFDQAVADEQQIMVDYGSGKYRLVLTNRKPAGEKGSPIEIYDFEIYNPKYPPRIPREVWKNDPRNQRWLALLPKEEPKPPAGSIINPLDAFGTFMDIQDRIQDRITPPAAPAAATPPVPPDPFDTAKKIMEMRANDPMIAALMSRLEAADKAQEAARQREFDLLRELRTNAATAHPVPKGLVEQIVELASVAEKLGPLKALWGGTNGSGPAGEGEKIVRAAKMGTLEFLSEVIPKVFDSPIANAAAAKIMQSTQQQSAPGMVNGNGRPPVLQQPPAVDPFQRFIADIATPAMLEYFQAEATGEALADWIYSVFPRECLRLQAFTHPMIPGLQGPQAIVMAYKNTPNVWPRLAAKEAEFTEFIQQFCAWKPEPEDAAPAADEDGWTAPNSTPDREEAPV